MVTLFVSPMQAQEAVLASTQGTVHFILRNGADHGEIQPTPVSLSMLGGHEAQPAVASPPQPRVRNTSLAIAHAAPEIVTILGGGDDDAKQGAGKP